MKLTILAMRFKTKTLKICLVVLCLLCSSCTLGSPQFNGATFYMKKIPLTQGKFALVDDEDFERINNFKWYANKSYTTNTWYAERTPIVNGKKINLRMHREILGITKKQIYVDHIDHDGLNNQKLNLRKCTASQNQANGSSARTSTSKYLGVSWDKSRGKWRASITKNWSFVRSARFDSEKDAAIAYNRWALEVHGQYANLNNV